MPGARLSSLPEFPKEDFLLPQRQMERARPLQRHDRMLYYIIAEGEVFAPNL
jgi:hypothetical protein